MKTMDRETLHKKQQNGENIEIVEVLQPEYYKLFHIAGAKNVPVDNDFKNHIRREIPDRQKEVVVYCQDENCPASTKAAQIMDEMGYNNVFEYVGGKKDWEKAGYPIEK